jgi:hypothetical protein
MDRSYSEDDKEKEPNSRTRIERGDVEEGSDGVEVNEVESEKRVCDEGKGW